MKRNPFIILIYVCATATVVFAAGVTFSVKSVKQEVPGKPVACTQEAKLCPDGSAVGRTGPNCQFADCPSPGPSPVPSDCSGPGDACPSGYTCIQKCGPPVARENDPPPGYYCERNEIASKPRMCPICLASNARIATPDGEVNVKELKVGDRVWSLDKEGRKIISSLLTVTNTPAPVSHEVVHLILSDGREVWISPNHPSANGKAVGSLRPGDAFDDAIVRSVERVPYWDRETYDLLPDSDTGVYWANDILLGSTLFTSR